MYGLNLSTAVGSAATTTVPLRRLHYRQNQKKLLVFASKQSQSQMELKFGRFLGGVPKLTLAKVQATNSVDGLNLVAPVPKKGVKSDEQNALKMRKPNLVVRKPIDILRKSMVPTKEDAEGKPTGLRFKPSFPFKTSNSESTERFSDTAMLRNPECTVFSDAAQTESNLDMKNEQFEVPEVRVNDDVEHRGFRGTPVSNGRGYATNDELEKLMGAIDDLLPKRLETNDQSSTGLKGRTAASKQSSTSAVYSYSSINSSVDAALNGKSKGLDQFVRETSETARVDTGFVPSADSHFGDLEDDYWAYAEELFETRRWGRVELISASAKGFVVSFGSLFGFLPYNNLTSRWKFSVFEPWLRNKGLDPSPYLDKLQVIQSHGIVNTNPSEVRQKTEGGSSPDMELEDLVKIHEQEKVKFLSSFVGQGAPSVFVVMVDRKSRTLIFSMKPRKQEEKAEKKRDFMAKLQIGDVVKCRILKIAYFGVLVEAEEVPALIQHSEVTWEAHFPSSNLKIGQILEARVHRLDFEAERIFLSIKEKTVNHSSSSSSSSGDTSEKLIGETDTEVVVVQESSGNNVSQPLA